MTTGMSDPAAMRGLLAKAQSACLKAWQCGLASEGVRSLIVQAQVRLDEALAEVEAETTRLTSSAVQHTTPARGTAEGGDHA